MYRYLDDLANVTLTPPLDYRPMGWLLDNCTLVVTDSGGLQEEASGFGKPVLVLRETTERPEGVEAGTARLVGTHSGRLEYWLSHLLSDSGAYARMSRAHSPYGDGDSAQQIVEVLNGSASERAISHGLGEIAKDLVWDSDVSHQPRPSSGTRFQRKTRRSDPPWERERILTLRG